MKEPLVYIIILNWNGYKDTIECIQSLRKIKYKNYKVVIVDNGSTNKSVSILKTKFSDINLIANKNNLGFSGGCNVGIKYAMVKKAEYILFLNNDTLLHKYFLTELINVAEKDKNIGIVSPMIYYANDSNVIWHTGAIKKNNRLYSFIDNGNKKIDRGQYKRDVSVDCVWGCCMLIKRNALKEVGYFNEDYFLYMEDVDLCIRVINKGYKIVFVPKAKIWHKVSGSSGGEGNINYAYYDTRNYLLLTRQYLTNKEKVIDFFYYLKDKSYELALYVKNNKYKNAFAVIMGIIHGITGKKGYCEMLK